MTTEGAHRPHSDLDRFARRERWRRTVAIGCMALLLVSTLLLAVLDRAGAIAGTTTGSLTVSMLFQALRENVWILIAAIAVFAGVAAALHLRRKDLGAGFALMMAIALLPISLAMGGFVGLVTLFFGTTEMLVRDSWLLAVGLTVAASSIAFLALAIRYLRVRRRSARHVCIGAAAAVGFLWFVMRIVGPI